MGAVITHVSEAYRNTEFNTAQQNITGVLKIDPLLPMISLNHLQNFLDFYRFVYSIWVGGLYQWEQYFIVSVLASMVWL